MPALHFPKAYADVAARLRVPFGFLLGAAFLLFSAPSAGSLRWGLPIAGLGLLLRGWAAGHLRKDRTLTMSGPYGYVRNPLYVGTLTAAIGLAVAANRWWLALLFLAFFLLVYLPAIELEQQHLADLFGPDFERYAGQVRMLVPRARRLQVEGRFSWQLYRYNREYQALMGFAAAALFLLVRHRLGG